MSPLLARNIANNKVMFNFLLNKGCFNPLEHWNCNNLLIILVNVLNLKIRLTKKNAWQNINLENRTLRLSCPYTVAVNIDFRVVSKCVASFIELPL